MREQFCQWSSLVTPFLLAGNGPPTKKDSALRESDELIRTDVGCRIKWSSASRRRGRRRSC
eukprot:3938700-Rhodomonas_salina.2